MDFVNCLPHSLRENGSVRVVVDRLTKSAHTSLVPATKITRCLVRKYVLQIVRLHGILCLKETHCLLRLFGDLCIAHLVLSWRWQLLITHKHGGYVDGMCSRLP